MEDVAKNMKEFQESLSAATPENVAKSQAFLLANIMVQLGRIADALEHKEKP